MDASVRRIAQGRGWHCAAKHWRQTYFSTPSSVTHQTYAFWIGAAFNKGRRKEDRIKVDVSYEALKHTLAKFVRLGLDDDQYFFDRGGEDEHEFAADSFFT